MLKTKPCASAIRLAAENDCRPDKVEQITKADFDELCDDNAFSSPPQHDGFGDGYGEPYLPYRQAFGKLKDDRFVYCELHPNRQVEGDDA